MPEGELTYAVSRICPVNLCFITHHLIRPISFKHLYNTLLCLHTSLCQSQLCDVVCISPGKIATWTGQHMDVVTGQYWQATVRKIMPGDVI